MFLRIVLVLGLSTVCWSLDLEKVSDAIHDCCGDLGIPDNVANQLEAIVQAKVQEATALGQDKNALQNDVRSEATKALTNAGLQDKLPTLAQCVAAKLK